MGYIDYLIPKISCMSQSLDITGNYVKLFIIEYLLCLGINEIRQMEIFRILSGILHMGNIQIDSEERCVDRCVVRVWISVLKHVL